jgi:hypothetical protein
MVEGLPDLVDPVDLSLVDPVVVPGAIKVLML